MAVGCWAGLLAEHHIVSTKWGQSHRSQPLLLSPELVSPPWPGPVACGATPLSFPAGMLSAGPVPARLARAVGTNWADLTLGCVESWDRQSVRQETGRELGPDRWVVCRDSDTRHQLSWNCFHQVTRLSAQSDTRDCPAGSYYPLNLSLGVGSYFPSIYIQT